MAANMLLAVALLSVVIGVLVNWVF